LGFYGLVLVFEIDDLFSGSADLIEPAISKQAVVKEFLIVGFENTQSKIIHDCFSPTVVILCIYAIW
jgi:hypothetical protein